MQYPTQPIGCIIWYKDTNLKAIHNPWLMVTNAVLLYYLIQRYKFESNSQHEAVANKQLARCIIWYKDTNLKAIHNNALPRNITDWVVLSDTKIQIWKQFTTFSVLEPFFPQLYYLIQRYKFESNSQRLPHLFPQLHVVLSDTKIQIWKQFTTDAETGKYYEKLYYLIQRYKFESNSQPSLTNLKS